MKAIVLVKLARIKSSSCNSNLEAAVLYCGLPAPAMMLGRTYGWGLNTTDHFKPTALCKVSGIRLEVAQKEEHFNCLEVMEARLQPNCSLIRSGTRPQTMTTL